MAKQNVISLFHPRVALVCPFKNHKANVWLGFSSIPNPRLSSLRMKRLAPITACSPDENPPLSKMNLKTLCILFDASKEEVTRAKETKSCIEKVMNPDDPFDQKMLAQAVEWEARATKWNDEVGKALKALEKKYGL